MPPDEIEPEPPDAPFTTRVNPVARATRRTRSENGSSLTIEYLRPDGGEQPIGRLAPVRLQLWSWQYDPEPTGIGPLSGTWARAMAARGHQVEVVTAHPSYPEPRWGIRARPYGELRDGIPVRRLPIWPGRGSALERVRQEVSFTASLSALAPVADRPDALVAGFALLSRTRPRHGVFPCARNPLDPLARGHPAGWGRCQRRHA